MKHLLGGTLIAVFGLVAGQAHAGLTLEKLRSERNLTPESFIKRFASFKFELGRDVRKPEVFLQKEQGDCDDFATLAADVLKHKGYTTRLIVVNMSGAAHVVCYVDEIKGYLDYNRRKDLSPVVKTDNNLQAIAERVAASFRTQWFSASEFTLADGEKNFVMTAFH